MPQALSEFRAVGRALDGIDVGTCVFDEDGRMVFANQAFLSLFPQQAAGLVGGEPFAATLSRSHPGGTDEAELRALERYVRGGMTAPDGARPFSFNLEGRRIEVAAIDIGAAGCLSVWRSPPQEAGPAEDGFLANYRLLAEYSSDVVALVTDGRIDLVSPSVERLLGRSADELAGQACSTLLAPDHATMLDTALQLDISQPFQARARHADGRTSWVEITLASAPYAPATAVVTMRDIDARKQAELQLQQASRELETMAHTDALTGAANRRSFDIGLEAEWRRTRRDGRQLALLLFDVDHFKRLNDSHGHPAGDEVLRRLAELLREHARRPGDLHARYGGEEFALILPSTSAAAALAIGDAVRHAFSKCFADRPELATTVSVGVAVAPDDAASTTELLQRADVALYRAKAQGRNCCVHWQRELA